MNAVAPEPVSAVFRFVRDATRVYLVRLALLAAVLWAARRLSLALIDHIVGPRLDDLFVSPLTTVLPPMIFAATAFFGAYWVGVRLGERRAVNELKLAEAPSQLVVGVAGGCGLMLTLFALIGLVGGIKSVAYQGVAHVAPAAVVLLVAAAGEELLFRGAVFRLAEAALGTGCAVALSALAFAGAHWSNHGVTAAGMATIGFGGACAAFAYSLSRTLWAPIGAHFAWNFMQGAVLGTAVSGHDARGVVQVVLAGPTWFTGGVFGPESTGLAAAELAVAAVALGALARRHPGWLLPRLRWTDPHEGRPPQLARSIAENRKSAP